MKKILSLTAFVFILFITVHAQDNKPEANSFGMQYGVNFNGTVSQAVQLSGWLKNGLEVRGSLGFSYVATDNSTTNNNYSVYIGNNTYLPGTESSTNSSGTLTVTPVVSVVQHFPVKTNLDFFFGGAATCGFTLPTTWTNSSTTLTTDNYYSYNSTSTKTAPIINWGMSLVGGANYFFYKNIAIGADFGLGFTAANTHGTSQTRDIEINNGSNNSNTNNNNTLTSSKMSNNRYAATLAGNAGLHLTYYLKVKKKDKKAATQAM